MGVARECPPRSRGGRETDECALESVVSLAVSVGKDAVLVLQSAVALDGVGGGVGHLGVRPRRSHERGGGGGGSAGDGEATSSYAGGVDQWPGERHLSHSSVSGERERKEFAADWLACPSPISAQLAPIPLRGSRSVSFQIYCPRCPVSVCSPRCDGHLRCHPPLSPPNPLRPVPHLAVSSLLAISDTKLLLTEARRAIGCRDRTAPSPAAASTTRNRLLLRFPSPRLRDTPPGGPTHTAVHNKNLPASRPVPSLERLVLSCPDRHLQRDGAAHNSIPGAADCFPALAKLRAIHDWRRPRVTTL
jgi:hypothetical protein